MTRYLFVCLSLFLWLTPGRITVSQERLEPRVLATDAFTLDDAQPREFHFAPRSERPDPIHLAQKGDGPPLSALTSPLVTREESTSNEAMSGEKPDRQDADPLLTVTENAGIVTSATESNDRISNEQISKRLEEIQASTELDENTKAELLKRYKAAQDWLKNAREADNKLAEYRADIEQAPRSLEEVKRRLAEPTQEPEVTVPPESTLEAIETLATEAQAGFQTAQEALDKTEQEVQRRGERKGEIAKLKEETKQRLEATRKLLTGPPAQEEPPALLAARKIELETRAGALESQLQLYKVETERYDACAELLTVTRDVAKRVKVFREQEASLWQQVVATRRKRETETQAAEARRQVQDSHPALRNLAERNAELANQRKRLADSIARIGQQLTSVNKGSETLEQQYRKAEQRVRRAGHSATVGLMLRRQREEIPSRAECDRRLREIESAMPKANLALMEIEEDREALADFETSVKQVMTSLDDVVSIDGTPAIESTVRTLLQTTATLLDSLATDYETYLDDLSELEVSNGRFADQIQKSQNYISEHVLWIRSSDSLWADDVTHATRGVLALSAPEPWIAMAKHCGVDTIRRPFTAVSVFVVVALILVFQNRLRKRMVALCSVKRGRMLEFKPTLEAILLAAVIAAEWPLVLAYFGWRLTSMEAAHSLAFSLGVGLQFAAVLLWVSSFVADILRSGGLAQSHFNWSENSTKLLRKKLRWITVWGIPLTIIVVAAEQFEGGEWSESLGRIAFVIGLLLFAHFMHAILNSKENILREAITQDSGNWFERLRAISYLLGVGVPCLLAMLAVAGYYYTAQQIMLRWQVTLGVALVLLFTYSVAARWCLVKRRNLAMQQARERQQKVTAEAEATAEAGAVPPAIQIEDQQVDLSAVHEQLQYLLRHAVTVCMVVASWFIWADVLPALRVLDSVVLWEKTVEVAETHETPDGKIERTTEERPVTTTLRHALFAILLIAAALIIGRHLPALLEVTVLQRMPFDKGGRYAVCMLSKYMVALLGLLLACRTLSVTWSSVQWLAAGMTVGLGFGLQEIFANLVSGLILLFERPIRVGDVITLGDITGTVTNMRIRATTVTNWDRKELIVPNKDLVTGRLLNWTLTDTTNRIVITVGVAYRCDPQRARDLILEVVASHPNVLADPGPNVTFEQFADSALNLVVRAYVSTMDVRLATVHDLHASIHATLRAEDIEIAFPQRDIHVRGVEHMLNANLMQAPREAA